MLGCFGIKVGKSSYDRRIREALKEVDVIWRASGMHDLDSYIHLMFDEVFYMYKYYHHVVSPLLLTHLSSCNESVVFCEGIRREYRWKEVLHGDVDHMEALRDHLRAAVLLLEKEKSALKERMVANNDAYRAHLYGRVFMHERELFELFQACSSDIGVGVGVGIGREIQALLDSDVTYEHGKQLGALFERYIDEVTRSGEFKGVFYMGVKRLLGGGGQPIRKRRASEVGPLEMEVRAVLRRVEAHSI